VPRATKLSAKVFLELPPVLAHYLDGERNPWIEGRPEEGKLSLSGRLGVFEDVESLAVMRRQMLQSFGFERARALCFRAGFEQGRREAARHYTAFDQNTRLSLQAGPVFFQLQGRGVVESLHFEYDLDERTLYRELLVHNSVEAAAHRVAMDTAEGPACWHTAGYFSGHASEIIGRRVLTLQTECESRGDPRCHFIARLDPEWGEEIDWVRRALTMNSVDEEMARRDRLLSAAQASARRAQKALLDAQHAAREEHPSLDLLVCESEPMAAVFKRIRQLGPARTPVLVVGEPGSGREVLARALHSSSPFKDGPFVRVDCEGLDEEALTRELLGYRRGAVAGALRDHPGALERAHEGTVYLNNVARIPLSLQGTLCTVLEEGRVTALGAEEPSPADIRLVAAAIDAPEELRANGTLREELFYALTAAVVPAPPLRDRGVDILLLAEQVLRQLEGKHGRAGLSMSEDFKRALTAAPWPGNVRQLRSALEHALLLTEGPVLEVRGLPEEVLAAQWNGTPRALTREVIVATLRKADGNKTRAADLLGVGRTTLWRAMRRFDIR